MGRKTVLNQFFTIPNGTDGSVAVEGTHTEVDMLDQLLYKFRATGDLQGEMFVQFNNDRVFNDSSQWTDLSFGEPLSVNASAEPDYAAALKDITFKRLRLIWEPSSGTGTVSCEVFGKGIGA